MQIQWLKLNKASVGLVSSIQQIGAKWGNVLAFLRCVFAFWLRFCGSLGIALIFLASVQVTTGCAVHLCFYILFLN